MAESSTNFSRLLSGAAALFIVIAGLWFLAPFISPVIMALFFAMLFYPVLKWLKNKGLGTGLALLIILVLTIVIGLAIVALVVTSFSRLAEGLNTYQVQFEGRLSEVEGWLANQGLATLTNPPISQSINVEQVVKSLAGFLGRIGNIAAVAGLVIMTMIFAVVEIPTFGQKVAENLGAESLLLARGTQLGHTVVRYFGLRAVVNLITGAGIALFLFILGVDYALLWGVLAFFLSFIPYLGLFIATIPAVLLAWAEFGPARAILVILGVMVANSLAENVVAPKLIGKGLSISPLVVFLSFFFWSWVLGPLGMFLSMPMTVIILMILDSFDETRWLARTISRMPAVEDHTVEAETAEA